ncbi:hypothetical protein EI94DRAFT_1787611 [Lactarius quietus]|nr:hypothetical protein EI94DRAFT_1787611 [Lactarius quietus]
MLNETLSWSDLVIKINLAFKCFLMKLAPPPPLNNPTSEKAFLAKNYYENARRVGRDPRGIFRTPNDVSAPLSSSYFSLMMVERVLAEMESIATLGNLSLGKHTGAPTSRIFKPDAARGTVELQESAESQGSCREPDLGHELWCWYYTCCDDWEAGSDRAEDVKW